jgi:hypothetical protein
MKIIFGTYTCCRIFPFEEMEFVPSTRAAVKNFRGIKPVKMTTG